MIDFTETQIRILRAILENSEVNSENEIEGLTSYDLRKIGISGRTFDINRDTLLRYQLITIVKEVTTGKQIRKWYGITPIGIFHILKITEIQDIEKKIRTQKFSKLIPLIGLHWDELKEMFGENLNLILKHSISQININPVVPKNITPWTLMGDLREMELEERTEIPFENEQYTITLVRKYHTYSKDIKEVVKFEPKLWDYDNYDDFLINLIDRLSFVFYFNLLRLNFSVYYRNQMIKEMTEYYKKKKPDFTMEELFDKELDIFAKFKSGTTTSKKSLKETFEEIYKKALKEIFKMIKIK